MNARAYLQSQGWRGEGHTLHPTNDSVGIKKRISVSRKNQYETKGLGSTQYVQEQWWLNSLQEQLSGLEKTANGGVAKKKVKKDTKKSEADGKSQLYRMFVRGGMLEGSVGLVTDEDDTSSAEDENKIERNNNTFDVMLAACLQSTLKPALREGSSDTTASSEPVPARTETKEERKAAEEAKRKRKEEKRLRRLARHGEVAKVSATSSDSNTTIGSKMKKESKEERRARKEAKRKRKDEKKRLKG
jgi:nucleolar protein TMA23